MRGSGERVDPGIERGEISATHEDLLQWIRQAIRAREYVMSLHAEEEMTAHGYTIHDVERGILTGQVRERQRDRQTGEGKYRIQGRTVGDAPIESVVKRSPTGKMAIITVYRP